MAKDPAFLFYPNDWIGGTMGMSFEEKGAYMELLMMQFNRGHMTSHMIGQLVGQNWDKIQHKFKKDENGMWFNERLEEEINRRKNYTKSRRNNISGKNQHSKNSKKNEDKKVGHMTSHMENENENISYYLNNNTNTDINKVSTKDLRDSNSENWIETKKQLIIDEQLHMKMCTTYGINKEMLEVKLIDFIDMLELKEDFKSYKETKNHFINWISKTIKEEKSRPYKESTGTERSEDYKKRKKLYSLKQEFNLIDS